MEINKPSTWSFRFIAYAVVLVLSYIWVASLSDSLVREKASKFCRSISQGEDAAAVVPLALEAGADLPENAWQNYGKDRKWLMAEFYGLPPHDGYLCTITAKNDRVWSTEFTWMRPQSNP
jgi:hypothetical protein